MIFPGLSTPQYSFFTLEFYYYISGIHCSFSSALPINPF